MRKVKFFRESEDFAGNRETWEFFQETRSNEGKILGSELKFFWECLLNIWNTTPDLWEDFYLHQYCSNSILLLVRAVTPRYIAIPRCSVTNILLVLPRCFMFP